MLLCNEFMSQMKHFLKVLNTSPRGTKVKGRYEIFSKNLIAALSFAQIYQLI